MAYTLAGLLELMRAEFDDDDDDDDNDADAAAAAPADDDVDDADVNLIMPFVITSSLRGEDVIQVTCSAEGVAQLRHVRSVLCGFFLWLGEKSWRFV